MIQNRWSWPTAVAATTGPEIIRCPGTTLRARHRLPGPRDALGTCPTRRSGYPCPLPRSRERRHRHRRPQPFRHDRHGLPRALGRLLRRRGARHQLAQLGRSQPQGFLRGLAGAKDRHGLPPGVSHLTLRGGQLLQRLAERSGGRQLLPRTSNRPSATRTARRVEVEPRCRSRQNPAAKPPAVRQAEHATQARSARHHTSPRRRDVHPGLNGARSPSVPPPGFPSRLLRVRHC